MDDPISQINKSKLAKLAGPAVENKHINEVSLDINDYAELTEEEKDQLDAEARAQVAEELRAARKKEFIKQQVQKYRRAAKPGQKICSLTLDLPGHANSIIIDGRSYFHGTTIYIPENQYNSMIDIQARAWEHENEIGGANRDMYKGRTPLNKLVSPNGVVSGSDHTRLAPTVKF